MPTYECWGIQQSQIGLGKEKLTAPRIFYGRSRNLKTQENKQSPREREETDRIIIIVERERCNSDKDEKHENCMTGGKRRVFCQGLSKEVFCFLFKLIQAAQSTCLC